MSKYFSIQAATEPGGIRVRLWPHSVLGTVTDDFVYYPHRNGRSTAEIVETLYGKPADGRGVQVVKTLTKRGE